MALANSIQLVEIIGPHKSGSLQYFTDLRDPIVLDSRRRFAESHICPDIHKLGTNMWDLNIGPLVLTKRKSCDQICEVHIFSVASCAWEMLRASPVSRKVKPCPS